MWSMDGLTGGGYTCDGGGQRVKVMVTDEEMGVESERDEWLRGRRANRTHSSLLLDVPLSKARPLICLPKWLLLVPSPGETGCNGVNIKTWTLLEVNGRSWADLEGMAPAFTAN